MFPISVLDLAPVIEGQGPPQALANALDLARHAEAWGYRRYWLAEHHNMVGIASAATAVVIGHIAAGTRTIRVGAGGIMLPNHSPLVIAEQFGTLESLFPGRIDLGLGRAPGTDLRTLRALRRDPAAAENFPQDVLELQALLAEAGPDQVVQAVPGAGTEIPLWILGSSLFGAQLAAMLGLPYGFASHFAPEALMQALAVYRSRFQPSGQLQQSCAMPGIAAIVADTDEEALRLFTSQQQQFLGILRGERGRLKPPVARIEDIANPAELAHLRARETCAFVGSPETVRRKLQAFIDETESDELIATAAIYDHQARLRSYELLAEVMGQLRSAHLSENGHKNQ